jgi:hypothetical protein
MLNTIVLITYCILLFIFLVMSILAIRHTAKFSYINSRFKTVVWAFGIVAVVVIILSILLLVRLYRPASAPLFQKTTTTTNIDY